MKSDLGNNILVYPAQSQLPTPPKNTSCPQGANNVSNQQSNIRNGAAVGFDTFAIAGTIVVANIIGLPEVEAAEAGAAPELIKLLSSTGGADAVAVGTLTSGIYGSVIGGGIGAALPTHPGCP